MTQGYLCQKLLFLHQLTLNMTTDCSGNYHENYKRRTWAECSFHGNSMNNLLSYCELVDAKISASEKDLPVFGCLFLREWTFRSKSPLNT